MGNVFTHSMKNIICVEEHFQKLNNLRGHIIEEIYLNAIITNIFVNLYS